VVGAGWQSGKFLYVDTDLKIDLPQAHVVLDREQLADLGLDLAGVGQELGTLLGGAYVNRFNYFDRSYKVSLDDEGATVGRCSTSRSRHRRRARAGSAFTASRAARRRAR
jgi:multidrug efflux pump